LFRKCPYVVEEARFSCHTPVVFVIQEVYVMRSGGYEQIKGFLGFTKRFPDEQSCRDFLFQ
jgi:hypothetical protein